MNHMQMSMGHQPQMPQQGQASNQVPNALPAMSGPLSIQISHGQLGQSAQANTPQIISSTNNANTMFQVKFYQLAVSAGLTAC